MNDEQLKQRIEKALAVDPSPQFLARVRQQIASETRRPALLPWRALATGLAGAGVLAGVIFYQPPAPTTPPPIFRIALPPAPLPWIPEKEPPPPAPVAARPVSRPQAEPEVLINPREAAAFFRFIDDIQQQRIDPSRLQDLFETAERARSMDEIRPLPIAGLDPIVVPPLSPVAPEGEGGSL